MLSASPPPPPPPVKGAGAISDFWPVFPVDRSSSDFCSTKRRQEMSLTPLVLGRRQQHRAPDPGQAVQRMREPHDDPQGRLRLLHRLRGGGDLRLSVARPAPNKQGPREFSGAFSCVIGIDHRGFWSRQSPLFWPVFPVDLNLQQKPWFATVLPVAWNLACCVSYTRWTAKTLSNYWRAMAGDCEAPRVRTMSIAIPSAADISACRIRKKI